MRQLDQTIVAVTGASSGIGHAIVQRLAADGATVVAASRSRVDLDHVEWVGTDVSSSADADRLIAHAVARYGRLDALVNNAGVQVERTVAETSDDEFDLIMDVNVRGVFNCARAAVRAMTKTGGGVIVNIGSVAGTHADHGMAVYNASKGAVHALTRAIATDHGRDGIRCVAVAPGWIATAMATAAFELADDPEAALAEAVNRHPVGRLGHPDDVAGLVAWLIGPDAGFVSGSVFTIDGGLVAQSPIGGT